jgi:molecular chaperone HscB
LLADNSNYFEFFNIPAAFIIDEKLLKDTYYQNTRQYHPDHFGQENEATQAEMLELSTLNNNAYKTLKDFNRRVHYLLDMHGLVTEGDKHTLPPDFLMEMMDVNEALMELEFEPNPEKLQQTQTQVNGWEAEINADLQKLGTAYDAANEQDKPALLLAIKEVYHKSKYILRLKNSLSTFATL